MNTSQSTDPTVPAVRLVNVTVRRRKTLLSEFAEEYDWKAATRVPRVAQKVIPFHRYGHRPFESA